MNIMNPPADWSTLKKLIWLRGTPINGGEELTVSGTPPLSLPNSLGKPLKAWEVGLEPVQDLHGYDSPWPAGGGKNKFSGVWPPDVIGTYAGWATGATRNMTITLFDKNNGGDLTGIYFGVSETGINTPVRWLVNNGVIQLTTLTTGDIVNTTLYPYVTVYPKNEETFNKVMNRFNVMACIDETTPSTTYSPYSNLCPIHGTDKVTITTAGKNLFDEEWELGIISNSTGQNAPSTTSIRTKNYIPISPNSQCTISWENSDTANIYALSMMYKADKSFSRYYSAFIRTFTFVPQHGECYVRFYLYNSTTPLPQCMINFGGTKLPYTPYRTPSQTVLTLPQTVYTGTIGSEGGESRSAELTVNNAKTINYNGTGSVPYVWLAFQDGKGGNADTQGNCITSMYPMSNQTFYDKHAKMYGTGIEIYDSDFTDRETALALLTNFVAVYKLRNPQTFTITSPSIPTPTGTATTWATAEDGTVESMEVTYVGKA